MWCSPQVLDPSGTDSDSSLDAIFSRASMMIKTILNKVRLPMRHYGVQGANCEGGMTEQQGELTEMICQCAGQVR